MVVLAWSLGICCCCAAVTHAFISPLAPGAVTSLRASSLTWRDEIDLLLNPATSLAEKEVLLQAVLKETPTIAEDVRKAAGQGKLVEDVLLPEGSESKAAVEGLKAVNKQIVEDILPDLVVNGPKTLSNLLQQGLEELPQALEKAKDSGVRNISAEDACKTLESVKEEWGNVWRRTPDLYSPAYEVVEDCGSYELRKYEAYSVAVTDMPEGDGTVFNTLASWLFGDNEDNVAMEMTTPVICDRAGDGAATMAFVLPPEFDADTAPRPTGARADQVGFRRVEEGQLQAVVTFPGFATRGEALRQLNALRSALAHDGLVVLDPEGSYSLLQYNPPYTAPWLRRNELTLKVMRTPRGGQPTETAEDEEEQPMETANDGETAEGEG
ncbi:unnamed protein product [Chrysoparadoxa australica]